MIKIIINDYIKTWPNLFRTCPVHNDTKCSLNVILQKNFKCFTCGVGGNAIKFISKIENIDNKKAKSILFEKYNFKVLKRLKTIKPNVNQQLPNQLFANNQEIAAFYHY
ncbi:CHC2 zinc finger domain-containing protein [Spiroplasma endosymbiont of Polydrusus pterygomalis]|uniref:CHC2 zinc finger domain-containing protein n=1 Tax=Spiroplasma endosymbiont of Polydrusus pterygomalis TaxID=3139327 RepID=UPI003CCB0CCC